MVCPFLPTITCSPRETQRFCVTAQYSPLDQVKDKEVIANGYLMRVNNTGQDEDGNIYSSDDISPLCAGKAIKDGNKTSTLIVGPCNTNIAVARVKSNYWVVAYDENDGHALIASGQPNFPTSNGLCTYSDPFSGMWILARSLDQPSAQKYVEIAVNKGIDPSESVFVNHDNC